MNKLTTFAVGAIGLGLSTLQAGANDGLERWFYIVNKSAQTIEAARATQLFALDDPNSPSDVGQDAVRFLFGRLPAINVDRNQPRISVPE
jgi:hypothetical protein